MPFVDKAREAGYTEEEIQEYLRPKVEAAQAEGYTPQEIGKHLGIKEVDHVKANAALASKVHERIQKGKDGELAGEAKGELSSVLSKAGKVMDPRAPFEAALALTTGALAGFPGYLVGGIGGLAAHYTYSPETDPKEIANKFAEALTYAPRTDAGQTLTHGITYPLQVLMEWSETAGKAVATKTDSALAGALTEATIQMLPAPFIGALGRRVHGKTPTESAMHTAARDIAGPDAEHAVVRDLADRLQKVYEETGLDPEAVKQAASQDASVLPSVVSSNRASSAGIGRGSASPRNTQSAPAAPPPPPPVPPVGSLAEAEAAINKRISLEEPKRKGMGVDELYTALKDDLYPIAKIEKDLTAVSGRTLATAESPYRLARLVRGSAGKATQFLDFGTFDWATYANTGPGLRAILAPFGEDLGSFRAYLVAKRSVELNKQGKVTGIPLTEAELVVARGGRFSAAADQITHYQNELTRYMKDAGIISEENFAAMLEANRDYVPFHRMIDGGGSTGTGRGMQVRNPIRELRGSERVVLDPLESIIKNTYLYTALAERNAVGRAFGDLVKYNPQGAAALGIAKVKTPMRAIELEAREIQKIFDEFVTSSRTTRRTREESSRTVSAGGEAAEPTSKVYTKNKERVMAALEDRGFTTNEAEIMVKRLGNKDAKPGDTVETMVKEVVNTENLMELDIRLPSDAATIFRPNAMRPAPNQIRFFENGKAITLEVPEGVAEAFSASDRQTAGMLLKILAMPARTLRAGAILTPDFMLRNVMRDQLTAFSFSKNGYIPVWDMVRGAFEIGTKSPVFESWLKSGGANSALVALDRAYLQQHLAQLNHTTGFMRSTWNVVSSPIEVLRIASELAENATRVGEFRRALGTGRTSKGKIQDAGFQSREITLDFQRIGAQTRGLNMIAAFMNAGVEGLDRTARAFKDRPLPTLAKVGASVTMPSVLLWYANNSTPERQARWREIPSWQRDLFWILLTDNHTIRFPKPFEVGVIFGSSAERMLDAFAADKPDAAKGFMDTIGQIVSVPVIPTGAVPVLEHATGHSMFRDAPLIPRRMEKLLPEYQYQEYGSQLTRKLGEVIGSFPGLKTNSIASPIVIDNYIRGWTGGLGVYATQLLDAGLRKAGVLPDPPQPLATLADIPVVRAFVVRYPSASAQSVQDFYEKHQEKKTVYATFQHLVDIGDTDAALKEALLDPSAFARLDGISDSLAVINDNIRRIHRNPDMTPADKRQLIDSMYGQMIDMTRAGNEAMREIDAVLNGVK